MTSPDLSKNQPATILVVENNLLVRVFAAEILSDAGMAVLQAADAATAINIISKRDVDLIFSNIGHDAETARPLIRWIEQNRPDMPILLTSAGSDSPLVGQYSFIAKPYRPVDLIATISKAFSEATQGKHGVP